MNASLIRYDAAHGVDEYKRLVSYPHLELYGRRPVEGWTLRANEIKAPPGVGIDDDLSIPPFRPRSAP